MVTLRGPKAPRRGALLNDPGIITDGAMLIRDGIIEEVGPTRRLERLAAARGAIEIDATGRVVIPAFVDGGARVAYSHTGAAHGEPGFAQACEARAHFVEGARGLRLLSRLRLDFRCRVVLGDMLRHGTTTVEAQSGYGLDEACEVKTLRVYRSLRLEPIQLIPTYLASTTPAAFAFDPGAYLEKTAIPLLTKIARRKLARFVDIRCASDGFRARDARRFLSAAREAGLRLKIQAQEEFPDESVGLAAEFAVSSISHVEQISAADVLLISGSSVVVMLCPGAAWKSRTGRFAPARALIDGGAAVSLASNFNYESSPYYSMPFIVALACRHLHMTPAESLAAATINSAYAAGCGATAGSLEAGKAANVLILKSGDYRDIAYFAGTNPVHTVLRNGRAV